ncbi:uncharacterized protein RCH25_052822 [Pelodytes ibericus]
MGPLPFPHPVSGSERVLIGRWLEVTTVNLKELLQMRKETEAMVRGALTGDLDQENMTRISITRNGRRDEKGTCWVESELTKLEQNMTDRSRVAQADVEDIMVQIRAAQNIEESDLAETLQKVHIIPGMDHIRPEITESDDYIGSDPIRSKPGENPREKKLIKQEITKQNKLEMGHVRKLQYPPEQVQKVVAKVVESTPSRRHKEEVNLARTEQSELGQEEERKNQFRSERDDIMTQLISQATDSTRRYPLRQRPPESQDVQTAGWGRLQTVVHEHSEDSRYGPPKTSPGNRNCVLERKSSLSSLLSELPALHRIGSGSLPPRLRLGSSGVTSDLLYTRRTSVSYAPSSGFYEASDIDSTSSSCSSLCSEASSSTPLSMRSPCCTTPIRPWSIDFTSERRRELRSGRGATKRPMSAGAIDAFLRTSVYHSRNDILTPTDEDQASHDAFSSIPPLSVIQQRHRVERYICKLALKYRCRPGTATLPTDLGPSPRRLPAILPVHSECPLSDPPSPLLPSLSCSVGDVRRTQRGSWGRFLSRVMLRKGTRTAASEMHLDQCGQRPQDSLNGSLLGDRHMTRAKSFRDLLSVNLFKKSERSLNKDW